MTKNNIIYYLCEKTGLTKKECASLVEATFDIIKDDLKNGSDIMISGFGKWTVKTKKERRGRNPQTGEEMAIKARKVVTFKPSTALKDKLNDWFVKRAWI